jgi:hypothetical protein
VTEVPRNKAWKTREEEASRGFLIDVGTWMNYLDKEVLAEVHSSDRIVVRNPRHYLILMRRALVHRRHDREPMLCVQISDEWCSEKHFQLDATPREIAEWLLTKAHPKEGT